MEPRLTRIALRITTAVVLVLLYVPLVVVGLYAFNGDRSQSWPITNWSTKWFSTAWENQDIRTALANSVKAALAATVLALLLGTCAAFAVARFEFFGRSTVSLVLILPIALPGIVTGIALNSTINELGIDFSLWTIIVGHTTFCIVVVYNNAVARLRRMSPSLVEASQDLGAHGWQTFRYVLLPNLRSALAAGALLAFALSFDEIVVTNFTGGTDQTLPKWIYANLRLPNARPQVNVVALVVIVLSIIPIAIAQRLTHDPTGGRGS